MQKQERVINDHYLVKIDTVLAMVREELIRARTKFPTMRSGHEGFAVIMEELDELWDDIKDNNLPHAKEEAVQVAAMAVSFVVDL